MQVNAKRTTFSTYRLGLNLLHQILKTTWHSHSVQWIRYTCINVSCVSSAPPVLQSEVTLQCCTVHYGTVITMWTYCLTVSWIRNQNKLKSGQVMTSHSQTWENKWNMHIKALSINCLLTLIGLQSLRFFILCHFAVFSWEATGLSPRLLVLQAIGGNPPTIQLVVRHRYTVQFFRS